MVDSIFARTGQPQTGMIAKLKVGKAQALQNPLALTSAENRLSDLLDLSPEAKKSVTAGRKIDAYLRMFNSIMQFINGSFKAKPLQNSAVSIEYVKLENPYLKTDRTI
jgi:hypothetical protein